jgi:isopenicillin N synthase-like dioxygenase
VFTESKTGIHSFSTACHLLCMRILELFAQGIAIDESAGGVKWFEERHDKSKGISGSVLRFLYYPALPSTSPLTAEDRAKEEADGDLRCGAHSDYGSITLLFRRDLPGQAGLEILTDDGTWAPVPVNPTASSPSPSSNSETSEDEGPPILVNVGDLLSFWTNGLLKSTVHRVVFPHQAEGLDNADRYSIAYFCHPLDDAQLEGVPSQMVTNSGHGIDRKVMTAKEHLESRLAATYT